MPGNVWGRFVVLGMLILHGGSCAYMLCVLSVCLVVCLICIAKKEGGKMNTKYFMDGWYCFFCCYIDCYVLVENERYLVILESLEGWSCFDWCTILCSRFRIVQADLHCIVGVTQRHRHTQNCMGLIELYTKWFCRCHLNFCWLCARVMCWLLVTYGCGCDRLACDGLWCFHCTTACHLGWLISCVHHLIH